MVIIELTYTQSLDVVEQYLSAHRVFLKKYFDRTVFLNSGPKIPRDGGVILANTSLKHANEIIQEDPFFIHDIADFRLIEFESKSC